MYVGMREMFLKDAYAILQKTFTSIKKFGRDRQKWEKAFIEIGVPSWKLKTLMKIKFVHNVILFQETLEYVNAINICYHHQSLQL